MTKVKIENIHVDSVDLGSRKYAIGWTIGADRFHVWAIAPGFLGIKGEIEQTIYKNPSAKPGEPGHYETRQLDRATKTQAAIFAEVMAALERGDLVRKAFAAARGRRFLAQRKATLERELGEIEHQVIVTWKAGDRLPPSLLGQYRSRELELAELARQTEAAA
jgi:hypothetical protein